MFFENLEDLMVSRRFEEVLNITDERLRDFPEELETLIFKCRALMALGRWDEAEEMYDIVQKHFPGLAKLYLDRSQWLLKMGRKGEALDCLQRSLALLPSQYISEEWLNLTHDMLEEREGKAVETRVDSLPGDDFYTITMAELYLSQGMVTLAKEILCVLAKREPDNERVLHLLQQLGGGAEIPAAEEEKRLSVIKELERWLNNLERLRKS